MKIYRTGDFHHKNSQGMDLVDEVYPWNGETDGIIICNEINEEIIKNPLYPHVIIGPGVDFAKGVSYFRQYKGDKKIVFNCLSPWNKRLIEREGRNDKVQYECIPFPVNTEKFKPALQKKRRFFVYFKNIHTNYLNVLLKILSEKKIFNNEHRIFIYGHYKEEDYFNYIREAEYGIWVGRHESQGFAFEEAMSCGCPLFVYDIKSMKDECINDRIYPWGHLQGDYQATAASYFDETCGIVVKEAGDISKQFDVFYNRLSSYRPREYVLNHFTARHFNDKVQSLFIQEKNDKPQMKDLVMITSVIHTSSNPLSYSLCRSVYSPTERFIQTKRTIQTIREKMPEAKIFLVESSVLTEEEETYFKTHCDYFINVINEPGMFENTTSPYKTLGEGSMHIKGFDYIQQQGFVFDNLFKISGRYWITDNFKYSDFDNQSICCRYAADGLGVGTLFYKLPYEEMLNFNSFLKENIENENMKNISFETFFMLFLKNKSNTKYLTNLMGVGFLVSVSGTAGEY